MKHVELGDGSIVDIDDEEEVQQVIAKGKQGQLSDAIEKLADYEEKFGD